MSDSSLYEMRQKLLEIQNQLIKSNEEKQLNDPSPPIPVNSTPPTQDNVSIHEVMSLLKELHSNQQKILNIVLEINSKLK